MLAACDTPSVYFRDATPTRISVDGSTFDVRVRGTLAEALRVNGQYAPRLGPIAGRAAFAMARVSGCKVTEVAGDQALVTGVLDCGGQTPDWAGSPILTSYSCLELNAWMAEGGGPIYFDYDCDPY